MWRCPHCETPQTESARCWVCHRSSTTCSTCRHFQTALSADVGWCALDPKRLPLTGREQRGCWQARPTAAPPLPFQVDFQAGGRAPLAANDAGGEAWAGARLDFVPVELVGSIVAQARSMPLPGSAVEAEAQLAAPPFVAETDETWAERTSLFGEPEG